MNYDDIESYLDDSVRTVTLKLDNVNDADLGPLHRTQGAAKLRSLVELITMEDLVALK